MDIHAAYKKLVRTEYDTPLDDQEAALKQLAPRTDAHALRMKRYLGMPDLSRTAGSPLKAIVDKVVNIPDLRGFDIINIPEVNHTKIAFDDFCFPPDHPVRSPSDTYYLDETHILRTHDTVMWGYYFTRPEIQKKIAAREPVGVLCYGKVYRKDEIDRNHMNVFHQIGGIYVAPDEQHEFVLDDLKDILGTVVKGLFGPDANYRFNKVSFPYTDPSLEVEVEVNGRWIEILGGGMPKKEVMKNFNVEGYNGWAFGFGLERLAIISMQLPDIRLLWSQDPRVTKQLNLGQAFQEVSKFPPVIRDISFVVPNTFVPNNYFDAIRDVNEDLIEEVQLLDKYENEEKFGAGNVSYAYRITYRSPDRTLTNEEVDAIHKQIEEKTVAEFGATVR